MCSFLLFHSQVSMRIANLWKLEVSNTATSGNGTNSHFTATNYLAIRMSMTDLGLDSGGF